VLVHEEVADEFKRILTEQLKNTFTGARGDKFLDSDKGAMINEGHFERIKGYLTESHGGRVLAGVSSEDDLKDAKNFWVPPTIIEDPNPESSIMKEEIFGPILPIIVVKDVDEAIKYINERAKPLAVYYFGCNLRANGKKVKNETSSGAFVQNEAAFQAVHPNLPFGGVGNSGYGCYHGQHGFRSMSHAKSCLVRIPLNFYPFNAATMPFTGLKQFTVGLFVRFGQIGQKQLIKRLIQLIILIWLIRGFASGRFQKTWRRYKPMANLVWGMIKPKFLK